MKIHGGVNVNKISNVEFVVGRIGKGSGTQKEKTFSIGQSSMGATAYHLEDFLRKQN